jgi:uncharacterized DUF497 family protein
MKRLRFEWDEKKYDLNQRKHDISFLEAQTVFADENGLLIDDPDHSEEEDRYILLGMSSNLRILVVSHTYRKKELIIKIISARKATRTEQKQYWNRW